MDRPEATDGRSRAALTAVALVVVVLLGVGLSIDDPRPPRPSTPAASVDAAPGTLLSAEPVPRADGGDGDDPSLWRIEYATTAPDGTVVPVTGWVSRPQGPPPADGYPVVAWGHVTTGVGAGCAPSRAARPTTGTPSVVTALDAVVVSTDYPGLGTPGAHPYLVAESEGAAVLDSVRAARALVGADVAAGPVGLIGWSQGGHAVLSARAMAPEYAPDLDLAATVAVAPVTDVAAFVAPGESNPDLVVFRLMVLHTWAESYEDLTWAEVTTAAADPLAEALEDGCTRAATDLAADGFLQRLWDARPEDLRHWRSALEHNAATPGDVDSPVLLVHGGADAVVPVEGTEAFADEACRRGQQVQVMIDERWDHGSVMLEAGASSVAWLRDRLAGDPLAATSCAEPGR